MESSQRVSGLVTLPVEGKGPKSHLGCLLSGRVWEVSVSQTNTVVKSRWYMATAPMSSVISLSIYLWSSWKLAVLRLVTALSRDIDSHSLTPPIVTLVTLRLLVSLVLLFYFLRKCGFSELLTHTHDRIAVLTYNSTYTLRRTQLESEENSSEFSSLLSLGFLVL